MYRAAKHTTSAAYHLGLATLTGGTSLLFTTFFSSVAHLARGDDESGSGNQLEHKYVQDLFANSEQSMIQEAALGVVASLWQGVTRPIAWSFISAGAAVDLLGYAGKGLLSIPMGLSRNGNAKLKNYWDSQRNFTCTHTARDFFWNIASIAPSEDSALSLSRNSLWGFAKRKIKIGDQIICDF